VNITEEIIEKINELYLKTLNMKDTAKEIGCSSSTVKKYLTKECLELAEEKLQDWDALYFYVYRLFGKNSEEEPVSVHNIIQMQRNFKKGMTYRGQLLTLKYIYEVKKTPIKPQYKTVGLIPYEYSAAAQYYKKQAKRTEEIQAGIKRQLEIDRIEIPYNPRLRKQKRKKTIDLNEALKGDRE
jgi:hypothetical protein